MFWIYVAKILILLRVNEKGRGVIASLCRRVEFWLDGFTFFVSLVGG